MSLWIFNFEKKKTNIWIAENVVKWNWKTFYDDNTHQKYCYSAHYLIELIKEIRVFQAQTNVIAEIKKDRIII